MSTSAILAVVFGAMWGICEALAAIPNVKSNSVFQLICSIISSLAGKSNPSS